VRSENVTNKEAAGLQWKRERDEVEKAADVGVSENGRGELGKQSGSP